MRFTVLLPILVFLGLCSIFVARLLDPAPLSDVSSALIGKRAPQLLLSQVETIETPLLSDDVIGKSEVLIMNIWASWCGPCRIEHPQIKALSEIEGVSLAGINYKDDPKNAAKFLYALGNPYDYIGADQSGAVSLNFGVYGVPETFIIDANGIIRAKYIGEISPKLLEDELKPLIRSLIKF